MEVVENKTFLKQVLNVQQQEALFEELFEDVNGYILSAEGKRQFEGDSSKSFTYGEVSFHGLKEILDIISPKEGSVFMDLGSGTGKSLFIASLTQTFSRLEGVELLQPLVTKSQEICDSFVSKIKDKFPAVYCPECKISEGNLLNYDIAYADVLLLNSTCFDEELMSSISNKVSILKSGAFVISFTKSIDSDDFEIIHQAYHKMGWGSPTVYIHKKK